MTLAKAQQITGYELAIYAAPELHLTVAAVDENGVMVYERKYRRNPKMTVGRQLPIILKEFVEWNYKRNSQMVFEAQSYRCANCGEMKPLQAHHRKHRSQGRNDRTENLVGLCSSCHEGKHAAKDRP